MRIDRIERLADLLKDNINAVLIGPSPDLEYLTGLTLQPMSGLRGYLFYVMEVSFYICPSLYFEETQKRMGNDAKIYVWHDGEGFLGVLKQAKDEFDLDNMCIAVMTVFLPFIF